MTTEKAMKNLLIVDSNDSVLWTLQDALGDEGFTVETTWSGYEALELLRTGEFHVLLIDEYLPDLHVTEFLQRMREMPVQPWTIVMQGPAMAVLNPQDYAALGACMVVPKNAADIRKAVWSCCAGAPIANATVN